MTAMKNCPDAFVKAKLDENFRFLVGEARPEPKGKSKNDDSITPEMWFHAMSPLHMFIFVQAFHECKARGLMNAFEEAACQELFDML